AVGTHRPRIDGWADIARRLRETVGPPDRGGVEDEVILRSRVESRRVRPLASGTLGFAAGNNLQTRNRRRFAMPFPPNETGNPLPSRHPRPGDQPVIGLAADPVATASYGIRALGPDQRRFVWAVLGEEGLLGKSLLDLLLSRRAESSDALDDPASPAVARG